jgi:hypothetical protein
MAAPADTYTTQTVGQGPAASLSPSSLIETQHLRPPPDHRTTICSLTRSLVVWGALPLENGGGGHLSETLKTNGKRDTVDMWTAEGVRGFA